MAATDVWERARIAAAERRWRAACELFAQAGRADRAGLGAADLELLSTALYLRGRTGEAFEALAAAHGACLDADDLVGAARTAGWIAIEALETGDPSLSASWAARGLRLVERSDASGSVGALAALVPAALAAMFVGELDEANRRFEGLAVAAARNEDRELAAHAALGQGISLVTGGRTAEGFAHLDDVMSALMADEVSPITTCLTCRIVLNLAHQSFDLERAETWTSWFAGWCARQPELVAYAGQSHAYRARLALLHGDWATASTAAVQAEESLRAGDFTAMYVAHYELADLHRLRGEFRPAEEHYDRAASTGWEAQPGMALLRLAAGDVEHAQSMMRRSLGGADDGRRRVLLPATVDAELAAGHLAEARRAADELVALSQTAPTRLLSAVAGLAEAKVRHGEGDLRGALDTAESAYAAWVALDAPYEAARCRLVLAQVLLALDDPEAAAVELDAARATFLGLGARPALGELAAVTGERPSGTLTAREAEVLRLVSSGLTNRGIANRLSLSEKTVARHLSNIFGKLGLSTRAAATAYAYEHGLV